MDAATGQIGIYLFNLEGTPITATQAGSLVNIEFHVVAGASVPATSVQLVSQVTTNGRLLVTEVDDDQGPLTLSAWTLSSTGEFQPDKKFMKVWIVTGHLSHKGPLARM